MIYKVELSNKTQKTNCIIQYEDLRKVALPYFKYNKKLNEIKLNHT